MTEGKGSKRMELQEIQQKLKQYTIKYPKDSEIEATICALRQYVPQVSTKVSKRFRILIKHLGTELPIISKLYWISSIVLFSLVYMFTIYGDCDPLVSQIILVPAPFILGLLEVLKGREYGMLEMEMSCKFSAYEVMLCRMLLIGVFTVILNVLFAVGFAPILDMQSSLAMMLTLVAPLTIFVAIALWMSMKFSRIISVMTTASLWVFFAALLTSSSMGIDSILNMNIALHLALLGLGVAMLAFQVKNLMNKFSLYEEGAAYEAGY